MSSCFAWVADAARRSRAARAAALAVAALLPLAGCQRPPEERIVRMDVVGTRFELRLSSGRVLSGADLRGATLALDLGDGGAPQRVRVGDVRTDPRNPGSDILVYRLYAADAANGTTETLCEPDADGERWAFPLRGRWDTEGRRIAEDGYTLVCGGDALGKCVRFGYRPWATLPDGRSLAPYHQACVNLVRAAYCGTGTTRNGMLIDLWDGAGVLRPAPATDGDGLTFEAAWNETGAVCVAHPRVREHVTLQELEAGCPRLRGRLGPEACTAETAVAGGERVLLFNRSR